MIDTLLSVASVFRTIGSVLLAILILLVMITIHEFGHWIAGKILHFGINEFSIGFGPALFKKKSKKTGQLFAIRLIPLGGYCAFKGEDGLDDEEEKKDETAAEETAEETGETVAEDASSDTVILTPAPEEEPQEEVKEEPQEEVKEEPKEEDFFADLPMPEEGGKKKKRTPAWKEKPDDGSFTRKAPWKRIIVLVAGALMNYVLALFLIIICFFAYGQNVVRIRGVAEPTEEYLAEYSFQEGDILLKGGGRSFYLTNDIARAINHKSAGDMVEFRVARKQADGSYVEVTQKIMLRGDVNVKNSSDFTGVWKALGVGVEEQEDPSSESGVSKFYMVDTLFYRFGFFETLGRSFVYSFKIAGSILRVIGELLTGRLGISAMGGPVSTIKATSEMASLGFQYFLEISALIGVNLAVFNLLPVPALDGSKVVFTIIEWIRGKPISRKVEAIIHAVGFVFLLGFAILVDILQFVYKMRRIFN